MLELKRISGKDCIKILCNKFGFQIARQRGSHVVLKKESSNGKIGTVVPAHEELKMPTLRSILKLAQVSEEEFSKYQ
ncbi:TPA: type II toxin-antitoxin system HicA family toxin [Candidatus Woesearchaeota archaeon]|nr:type II toxin-antitoxin system HicA family toxin [Candidatus Woesearchaeota archaeon]HIH39845.1 type II toxin-antitoxin system HicA family toxin [Candidatus Woesearchaeota archaeon]